MSNDDRPEPTPPIMPGYTALAHRVEYMHSEHKAFRDQAVNRMHDLDGRTKTLELLDRQKDERLDEGARTFAALRDEIKWPWWKTIIAAVPFVLIVAGWAFQIGQTSEKFRGMDTQLQELKVEQVKTQGTLYELQSSQREISNKLDRAILFVKPSGSNP